MRYPLIRPRYYRSLFGEIAYFVRDPKNTEAVSKSTKQRVCDTIGLFILKMMILVPVSIIVSLFYDPENLTGKSLSERFSPVILLLVGGVILPLVEEVGFRLSLKFRPIYLAMSSSVFVYYFLTKVVFRTNTSAVDESFSRRVVVSMVLGIIAFLVVNVGSVRESLARFWEIHFRSVYYVSFVVFAMVHMSKYEMSWVNAALFPILTLPQLMSGIISGYTRVAFGFYYPLFFHMFTNFFSIGLSFLPFEDLF